MLWQWVKSANGSIGMPVGPLVIIFTSIARLHIASECSHANGYMIGRPGNHWHATRPIEMPMV